MEKRFSTGPWKIGFSTWKNDFISARKSNFPRFFPFFHVFPRSPWKNVFPLFHFSTRIYIMRGNGKIGKIGCGKTRDIGNVGRRVYHHEDTETPSAARKRLGKRRLRNIQPPESRHMERGRLPAVCPKASFLLLSVSRECGLPCRPWYFTPECLIYSDQRGSRADA